MTQALLDKGHAYEVNGNVYFSVSSFGAYGKLSGNTLDKLDGGGLDNAPGELLDACGRECWRNEVAMPAVLRRRHALHRPALGRLRETAIRICSGEGLLVAKRCRKLGVAKDEVRGPTVVANAGDALPLAQTREHCVQVGQRVATEIDFGAQEGATSVIGTISPPWHARLAPVIQPA